MSVDMIRFLEGWARQWADQRGGASNYDWNGTNPIFAKYAQDYGVDLQWNLGAYSVTGKDVQQVAVYSSEYGPFDNDRNITFNHSYTESDSFEWSITESISMSQTTSISVGVPDVFGADTSLSFDLSLSKSEGQQKQRSHTWDTTMDFDLPAREKATLEMILTQATATATANLEGLMRGRIAIGLDNRWNGHYFWFVSVAELAAEFNKRSDIAVVDDKSAVRVRVPVQFRGVGVNDAFVREKRVDKNGKLSTLDHPGLRTRRPLQEVA